MSMRWLDISTAMPSKGKTGASPFQGTTLALARLLAKLLRAKFSCEFQRHVGFLPMKYPDWLGGRTRSPLITPDEGACP